MLSLSTKVRYATRVLIDISVHSSGKPIPLQEISDRQGISMKYLESIMPGLKSAGLITSSKGPHGGYLLNRPKSEVTLLDVLSAFGGPVSLVGCVNNPSSCERQQTCAAYDAWKEISNSINSSLESITIEDLALRQTEKEKGKSAIVYYI